MFIKLIIIALLAAVICGPRFEWDPTMMGVAGIIFAIVACATADGLIAIIKRLE